MNKANNYTAEPITLTPIAYIRSCYPERFGIPRQAGLVPSAVAEIVFEGTEDNKLALRGLEQFSHLWVIFVFHKQSYKRFKPLVQPPRLGGRKTMGVYATRSPNRPNNIGMSAVQIETVEFKKGTTLVHIRGGDFLDGTPVLDIKPYIPYADAIATAHGAWTTHPETPMPIAWSQTAETTLTTSLVANGTTVRHIIEETLTQDPRPAHERGKDGFPGQTWNMEISAFSVFWKVENGIATVTQLVVVR